MHGYIRTPATGCYICAYIYRARDWVSDGRTDGRMDGAARGCYVELHLRAAAAHVRQHAQSRMPRRSYTIRNYAYLLT